MIRIKKLLFYFVLFIPFVLAKPVFAIDGTSGPCLGSEAQPSFTCSWSGSSWQVNNSIIYCGSTPLTNTQCSGSDQKKFGNTNDFCLPCQPNVSPTKGHGDACTNSNECKSGLSCINSLCLGTNLTFPEECVIGQNECKTIDPGSGLPQTCVKGSGKFGSCQTTTSVGGCSPETVAPAPPGDTNSQSTKMLKQSSGVDYPFAYCHLGLCVANTTQGQPSDYKPGAAPPFYICEQIPTGTADYNSCVSCSGTSDQPKNAIWTAVGCINSDPRNIVQKFLQLGLNISGGVALLMILAAGFM